MLRSAYKHFSCLNLAEVTSKNDSKPFKVAPVDGHFTAIWHYIWLELVGFICANTVTGTFLSDHPAQKSRWGDADLPYNLSTGTVL